MEGLVLHMQPLEGASTLVGTLTCGQRLPAGTMVMLYPDPDHYKDVSWEKRPSLRRVLADGSAFRFHNLALGVYRVSVSARQDGLRFSGGATVDVRESQMRTEVEVKAAKIDR